MKRILHTLFYILLLSLSLGGLAGASPKDDVTSFFQEASSNVWVYDIEASSDTDDVVANAMVVEQHHGVTTLISLSPDSRLLLSARFPDARGPPQIL